MAYGSYSTGSTGSIIPGTSITTVPTTYTTPNPGTSMTSTPSSYPTPSSGSSITTVPTTYTSTNPPPVSQTYSASSAGNMTTSDQPEKIYTWNTSDYQCDFQSWNKAVENNVDPRVVGPTIDYNNATVNQIYDQNYADKATSAPVVGTKGFGFYSNSGVESDDPQHMVYYEYTGGNTINIWDPQKGPVITQTTYRVDGSMDGGMKWVALPSYP